MEKGALIFLILCIITFIIIVKTSAWSAGGEGIGKGMGGGGGMGVGVGSMGRGVGSILGQGMGMGGGMGGGSILGRTYAVDPYIEYKKRNPNSTMENSDSSLSVKGEEAGIENASGVTRGLLPPLTNQPPQMWWEEQHAHEDDNEEEMVMIGALEEESAMEEEAQSALMAAIRGKKSPPGFGVMGPPPVQKEYLVPPANPSLPFLEAIRNRGPLNSVGYLPNAQEVQIVDNPFLNKHMLKEQANGRGMGMVSTNMRPSTGSDTGSESEWVTPPEPGWEADQNIRTFGN